MTKRKETILTPGGKIAQQILDNYDLKNTQDVQDALKQALGLEIDDEGNFYDPLGKDLDNDGVPDRYDNAFRDSDYLESTYDVEENLHAKEEKPSVLGQIKSFQAEQREKEVKDTKAKEHDE